MVILAFLGFELIIFPCNKNIFFQSDFFYNFGKPGDVRPTLKIFVFPLPDCINPLNPCHTRATFSWRSHSVQEKCRTPRCTQYDRKLLCSNTEESPVRSVGSHRTPNDSAHFEMRERSGSVVDCLTRDRKAAGSSLTGVTVLWSLSKTHLS